MTLNNSKQSVSGLDSSYEGLRLTQSLLVLRRAGTLVRSLVEWSLT